MFTSGSCRSRLDQVMTAIDEKNEGVTSRNDVVFYQVNVRIHVSWLTLQKLIQFGWDILLRIWDNTDWFHMGKSQ